MDKSVINVSLDELRASLPYILGSNETGDFFMAEVRANTDQFDDMRTAVSHPCRFDGFLLIICVKGEVDVGVNLETYKMSENLVLLCFPGSIITINRASRTENIHVVLMAASSNFVSGIKLDLFRMSSKTMRDVNLEVSPYCKLEGDVLELCRQYIILMLHVMKTDFPTKSLSLNSLVVSAIYLLGSQISKKESLERDEPSTTPTRGMVIFRQFINLVTEYHTSQRNMAFYAGKLCLTPKYLSKLIKQVSGKSAPDWIDEFVILESKNMLKFSDFTIKEIVYKLNFPNQSVFYKFFKSHTGLTPSEYRNS